MMKFNGANVSVTHPREPWGGPLRLLVHCRLDELKGTAEGAANKKINDAYMQAKREFNISAAFDVIERCISERVLDDLADVIMDLGEAPRIIFPHPEFNDAFGGAFDPNAKPKNALPFAYANFLASNLGCEVDTEIVQAARVGRSELNGWLRFLCQPSFVGEVAASHPYIIVDDVTTTGGTLAALRSYVVRKGSAVPITSVVATADGSDRDLAIGASTTKLLATTYGPGLEAYWLGAIGHEVRCLTEAEGQFLVRKASKELAGGAESLHRLRDRLNQAAAKGG